MTTRSTRRRSRLLVGLVGALSATLLAGCGLPTAGGFVPTGKLAGPLADVKPLDGATIAVGSKNFSENVLLGKMAIILMQSDGASVTDLTNIPGSAAARQAMLDDRIQAMWEYTGTGWITYLGHTDPIADEEKQYNAVKDEDKKKNNLDWLPPAPMNNTYGFAVTQETADKYKHHQALGAQQGPGRRAHLLRRVGVRSTAPTASSGMLEKYAVPLGDANGVPQKHADLPDRRDLRRDGQGRVQLRRGVHHRRPDPGAGPEGARGRPQVLPQVQRLAGVRDDVARRSTPRSRT